MKNKEYFQDAVDKNNIERDELWEEVSKAGYFVNEYGKVMEKGTFFAVFVKYAYYDTYVSEHGALYSNTKLKAKIGTDIDAFLALVAEIQERMGDREFNLWDEYSDHKYGDALVTMFDDIDGITDDELSEMRLTHYAELGSEWGMEYIGEDTIESLLGLSIHIKNVSEKEYADYETYENEESMDEPLDYRYDS